MVGVWNVLWWVCVCLCVVDAPPRGISILGGAPKEADVSLSNGQKNNFVKFIKSAFTGSCVHVGAYGSVPVNNHMNGHLCAKN